MTINYLRRMMDQYLSDPSSTVHIEVGDEKGRTIPLMDLGWGAQMVTIQNFIEYLEKQDQQLNVPRVPRELVN